MENNNVNYNQDNKEESKKGFNSKSLIVPGIIAIIIIVFIGVVYWAKMVKPKSEVDEELGYNTEEYIKLGKIKGLEAEITQEEWDECVNEDLQYYEEANRESKDTDQVDFDITGYVDGKKDDNLTLEEQSVVIGEDKEGLFGKFSKALKGQKKKYKTSIEVDGEEANELSFDGTDYSGKKVTFKLKIVYVNKLVTDKVTDEYVKENYEEDRGITTIEEFYEWEKNYLIETSVKEKLWKMAVDNAKMSGYPAELYNDIVDELDGHIEADAKEQGMDLQEYKNFFGYTDEALDEEYTHEVKSELVMWQMVKELKLEASAEEIEEMYEKEYEEVNLDSVEEMKEMYTAEEMKEAVLLEKAKQYVFDNATINYNYKIAK